MDRYDIDARLEAEERAGEAPPVLALQMAVGGSVQEIAEEMANNPEMIVEMAAVMGVTVNQLKMQMRRVLVGKSTEMVDRLVNGAGAAMRAATNEQERRLGSQSKAHRKALAVARMEACYNACFTLGLQTSDFKAIKAAANIAKDIASVDGSSEQVTAESTLEKAADAIRDKRRMRLKHNPGRTIEGAVVGGEVRDGEVEVGDLGGAIPVGLVEFDR
jgi:hypothetical protein